MAGYSTASPPVKICGTLDGKFSIWYYESVDASTVVDAANYFTNGGSLGMKVGDIVFVKDTDESPVVVTMHQVSATGDGTVDINDATTITQTDSR